MASSTVSVTIVASTTGFKLIIGIIEAIKIKWRTEPNAIEKLAYFSCPNAARKGKTNRIEVATTRIKNENRKSTVF